MLRIRTANLGGRFSPGGAFGGRGHGFDSSRPHSFQSPGVSKITPTSAAPWLVFFAAASFAGSLPSIDISISFWPAAALRGFLAGLAAFAGAAFLPPDRPSASIRSTTLVAAGFDLGVIGFAPNARKKVIVPPRSDLALRKTPGLSHDRLPRFRRLPYRPLNPRLSRALLRRRRWQRRLKDCVSCFLGLTNFSKPRHVLTNIDGLLFDIGQCPRSLFSGQALTIGTRDGF